MIKHFDTKEQWLEFRKGKISGTKASAIVGLNPYMDNQHCWELLVGICEEEDISYKPCVVKGAIAEDYIRKLWALDHPNYKVIDNSVNGYDVVYDEEHPFIMATTDGFLIEVVEIETGRKGVLEIKTSELLSSYQKEKWDKERIPDNYYIQVLQEMYCAKADFAILVAELKYSNEVTIRRTYFLDRKDYESDIQVLISKEIDFYEKYVKTNKRPSKIITIN